MRSRSLFSLAPVYLASTGVFLLQAGDLSAATVSYWNPDGTGGDGNWGTSPGEKNWNPVAAGSPGDNFFWQDGIDEIAVFQDSTGGIVTVIDSVQTTGIRQSGANYTLNAGTIVLAPDSASERPFIDVASGSLAIDSLLDGTAGLLKSGTGDLVLTRDTTYTGLTTIAAGRLILGQSLASASVEIGSGAGLIVESGGLRDDLVLTNSGTLTLNSNDTVTTYVSHGGELASAVHRLDADQAELNDGSVISGHLRSATTLSHGAVLNSGRIQSGLIDVGSGVWTNTGILDASGGRLNLGTGATLAAAGTQQYGLLTTGAGTGTWQGNLTNSTTIAPGGHGATGTLRVEGDFANLPAGTVAFDAGASGLDRISVTGTATFGGTLELRHSGLGEIEAMTAFQIFQAGSYAGQFATMSEDLAGTVIFNPLDGSITRLEIGGDSSLMKGLTGNQASTWAALYDDVIDPGTANVSYRLLTSPPWAITSGMATTTNPDLLWALAASITPDGLDRALLNRLSPEVYAGLSDYGIQSTRTHRRSALEAPALARAAAPATTGSKDAKDAKGLSLTPALASPLWEVFAAADYFDAETSGSLNGADYSITGSGAIAGARIAFNNQTRLAAYVAANDGDVRGSLIDATACGGATGVLGEILLGPSGAVKLTGGLSYGSYTFDGTRGTVMATGAGWSPGLAAFRDVDTDVLDLFLGLETVAWRDDRFLLIPSIGMSFTSATTGSFREFSRNAAGSPIALAVDQSHRDLLVVELGLAGQARVTDAFTLDGQVGLNLGTDSSPDRISASYGSGGRPFAATTVPLDGDLAFLSIGATWTATETIRVRLGYRVEFRSDAEPLNTCNLGATFGF